MGGLKVMPGRKRVPQILAELHGNPRKQARRAEPQAAGNLVTEDAPDDFTEAQRALWADAIAHAPPGLLRRIDRALLAVWTVAADLHRQAAAELAKGELIAMTPNGAA